MASDEFSLACFLLLGGCFLALWCSCATGRDYLSTQNFLTQTFGTHIPAPNVFWLAGERQSTVTELLQHPPTAMRLRYWRQGSRVAWVINEIGKEQPITFGVVVEQQAIESIQVLAFRESRGGEIRFPAYRNQYRGASLKPNLMLDKQIDGITGATLSVRAMQRVARLALYATGVIVAH